MDVHRKISQFFCPFCKKWHEMKNSKTLADYNKVNAYDLFWCEEWNNYFSLLYTEESLVFQVASCTYKGENRYEAPIEDIKYEDEDTVMLHFEISDIDSQRELCKSNHGQIAMRFDCARCTSKKYKIFQNTNLEIGFRFV